mmetsp:Transcript_504/g.1948  ORF Transcript_504/g.1948 Transcript_504/m.1948 type:complete len:225 (+) Transcript_504:1384-2058(+)
MNPSMAHPWSGTRSSGPLDTPPRCSARLAMAAPVSRMLAPGLAGTVPSSGTFHRKPSVRAAPLPPSTTWTTAAPVLRMETSRPATEIACTPRKAARIPWGVATVRAAAQAPPVLRSMPRVARQARVRRSSKCFGQTEPHANAHNGRMTSCLASTQPLRPARPSAPRLGPVLRVRAGGGSRARGAVAGAPVRVRCLAVAFLRPGALCGPWCGGHPGGKVQPGRRR